MNLCDAGAMLYQLSYEATQLAAAQFVGLISSRERNDLSGVYKVTIAWIVQLSARTTQIFRLKPVVPIHSNAIPIQLQYTFLINRFYNKCGIKELLGTFFPKIIGSLCTILNRAFPSVYLLFKASLSANSTYEWKLIYIRKTSHLDSLWKGDRHELGNGLFRSLPDA